MLARIKYFACWAWLWRKQLSTDAYNGDAALGNEYWASVMLRANENLSQVWTQWWDDKSARNDENRSITRDVVERMQ